MNLEKLFQVLSAMHPLSEELKQVLRREIIPLSLPKNYFLLEAPKISDQAHFIESGFAVSFVFIHGQKQIERFYEAGEIVMSAKSFFEQLPSKEFIQLIEPSEVLHLSHAATLRILETFPEANIINRKLMNQSYEQCKEHVYDLQYLSATERYKKLHDRFPRIEQLVPQEYVASFLGITPQSLSRLKKKRRDF